MVALSLASSHKLKEDRVAGPKGSLSRRGFSGVTVRIRFLLGEVPDKFDAERVML